MLGRPSKRKRRRLESEGVRAMATVLEVKRKLGVTHGPDNFVQNVEIDAVVRVRVEPEGAEPFETESRMRFPQLALPSAGSQIPVIYDPGDRSTIIYDDSAGSIETIIGDVAGATPTSPR